MNGKREVREFVEEVAEQGWQARFRKNGHMRLDHRSGAVVFIAATPSDWRWKENARTAMRRALREGARAN